MRLLSSPASFSCPFCAQSVEGVRWSNERAVALYDAFPVTRGHVLVAPRRHEPDFFSLAWTEQLAVWELVTAVRDGLAEEFDVTDFNVGLNAGAAAGQTVWHAHLHVIPRRDGDVPDPRGGVRWVVPQRAAYWSDVVV